MAISLFRAKLLEVRMSNLIATDIRWSRMAITLVALFKKGNFNNNGHTQEISGKHC